MEIREYRLGEICELLPGKDLSSSISFNKILTSKKTEFPYIKTYCIGKEKTFPTNEWISSNYIDIVDKRYCYNGDLLFVYACSIGNCCIWDQGKSIYSRPICKINTNENIIKKKYLYFWFKKNNKKIISMGVGSVLKKFRLYDMKEFKINVPTLDIQQQIINIIEPKEELFIKYSNLVRIDDINNFKHDWDILINIIEPFEKNIDYINELKNNIDLLIKMQINKFKNNDEYIGNNPYILGYSFSCNDIVDNGKFKIFKIGNIASEINKKSSETNLNKSKLFIGDVVSGLSGTIGTSTIVTKNEFVLNQRLICIRSKVPLIIKHIIIKYNSYLKNVSTGSVQMNITSNDILGLKYDSRLNNELNYFLSKIYINLELQLNTMKTIISNLIDLFIK